MTNKAMVVDGGFGCQIVAAIAVALGVLGWDWLDEATYGTNSANLVGRVLELASGCPASPHFLAPGRPMGEFADEGIPYFQQVLSLLLYMLLFKIAISHSHGNTAGLYDHLGNELHHVEINGFPNLSLLT
jgi:hypothetical protein